MVDNYNYIIAHYWPDTGQLSSYSYGSDVHYGSDKEAKHLLAYVKIRSPDKDWKIFKIQENVQ